MESYHAPCWVLSFKGAIPNGARNRGAATATLCRGCWDWVNGTVDFSWVVYAVQYTESMLSGATKSKLKLENIQDA